MMLMYFVLTYDLNIDYMFSLRVSMNASCLAIRGHLFASVGRCNGKYCLQ